MILHTVVYVSRIIRITGFSYSCHHLGIEISFPSRYFNNMDSYSPPKIIKKKKKKGENKEAQGASAARPAPAAEFWCWQCKSSPKLKPQLLAAHRELAKLKIRKQRVLGVFGKECPAKYPGSFGKRLPGAQLHPAARGEFGWAGSGAFTT